MKRVLCIISSLNAGGAETFLMKIYRTLPNEVYQLDFLVSEENGCYTEEVLNRGGRIYFVPTRREHPIKSFWAIMKIVKQNHYKSVLKLGSVPMTVTDLIAAKLGGAKMLAMRSCNALAGLSVVEKICDFVFRPILNAVANVKIAPSKLAAIYTFGKRQVNRGNVYLLNNAVDLNVFSYDEAGREAIRQELGLQDKLVVGHIGRFSRQKNHEFLLDIFRAIKEKNENAALLLVGKGELEESIRKKAEELGLTESVVLTGVRADVPQLLSAMDVFVFPSLFEGMPNTVIEAQATGLPCVIADTITPEADITGLVKYLPLEKPESWAEAALTSVRSERLDTKEMFVHNKYDINSVAQEFTRLVFEEA
ncbi:MAG: glycosyltransferase family 1 protein [Oscillospiraceae bacterium]|nr:glycosyltransferase family 1 protein [Oscillospiraceae bacterium]